MAILFKATVHKLNVFDSRHYQYQEQGTTGQDSTGPPPNHVVAFDFYAAFQSSDHSLRQAYILSYQAFLLSIIFFLLSQFPRHAVGFDV